MILDMSRHMEDAKRRLEGSNRLFQNKDQLAVNVS